MSYTLEPIVLYDLESKNVTPRHFSANVLPIHMLLRYLEVPYTTEYLRINQITPTLSGLGVLANSEYPYHTVPAIKCGDQTVMDKFEIYRFLGTQLKDVETINRSHYTEIYGDGGRDIFSECMSSYLFRSLFGTCFTGPLSLSVSIMGQDPADPEFFVRSRQQMGLDLLQLGTRNDLHTEELRNLKYELDGLKSFPWTEFSLDAKMLLAKGYLYGDCPSFGDYILVGYLYWLELGFANGMQPLPDGDYLSPRMREWYEKLKTMITADVDTLSYRISA